MHLDFDLHAKETVVSSALQFVRNAAAKSSGGATTEAQSDLVLDGEDIALHSLKVNGVDVLSDVSVGADQLTIPHDVLRRVLGADLESSSTPTPFDVQMTGVVSPEANVSGSGLYIDGGGSFLTQCEANGFRKICYFPDRPDILSHYEQVTLRGAADVFPVMLSNGNLVSETVDGDRRTAVWSDPHLKPCYLFALVAGNLEHIRGDFKTKDGRNVDLFVYSEPKDLGDLQFAMASLKQSMAWDESR